MIKFGPAGNCQMFYEYGYKNTIQMPEFLNKIGLMLMKFNADAVLV